MLQDRGTLASGSRSRSSSPSRPDLEFASASAFCEACNARGEGAFSPAMTHQQHPRQRFLRVSLVLQVACSLPRLGCGHDERDCDGRSSV
eukprot:1329119-Rhodomonas_salina.4